MEKIVIGNENEFNIIPDGIRTNESKKRRTFSIISDMTYSEIETIFSDRSNLSVIQLCSASGDQLKSYYDCVSMKSLSKIKDAEIDTESEVDTTTVTDVYVVEVSTDTVEKDVQILKDTVDTLVLESLGV